MNLIFSFIFGALLITGVIAASTLAGYSTGLLMTAIGISPPWAAAIACAISLGVALALNNWPGARMRRVLPVFFVLPWTFWLAYLFMLSGFGYALAEWLAVKNAAVFTGSCAEVAASQAKLVAVSDGVLARESIVTWKASGASGSGTVRATPTTHWAAVIIPKDRTKESRPVDLVVYTRIHSRLMLARKPRPEGMQLRRIDGVPQVALKLLAQAGYEPTERVAVFEPIEDAFTEATQSLYKVYASPALLWGISMLAYLFSALRQRNKA